MAVRTTIACDLCSSEPAATNTIAALGATYELDLCEAHTSELSAALEPFLSAARVTGGKRPKKSAGTATPTAAPASRPDLQAIRDWAAENGHDVKPKGRIPAAVVEAFDAATKPSRRRRKK